MKKTLLLSFLLIGSFTLFAQTQNALSFDGTNDFVQTTFPGVAITADRTFEAHIKVSTSAPSNNLCILDYGTGASGSRNTFMVNTNQGLSFFSGGTNGNLSSTTGVITAGQWVHVAFVLSSGTGFLYVDGVQVGTGNLSGVNTPSTGNSVRIGRRVPGGNLYFSGEIDEVRIWNRALSTTEIGANMNTELCPDATGLLGYYQFNEGAAGGTNTSITTLPNIVASTDGTLTNFALSGTSSNWVAGPSMVTAILDDEVTESNGVLTAQQSGASYRWIRCSDGVVISGETAMTFTPTATGFYAGEITFNGCTQVSECVEVTTLGEESFQLNNLVLFQNPSQFLSFKGAIDQEAVISIYSISGKELLSASLNDSQTIQPTIANGLYMVTVSQNGASKTFKWIKE